MTNKGSKFDPGWSIVDPQAKLEIYYIFCTPIVAEKNLRILVPISSVVTYILSDVCQKMFFNQIWLKRRLEAKLDILKVLV